MDTNTVNVIQQVRCHVITNNRLWAYSRVATTQGGVWFI